MTIKDKLQEGYDAIPLMKGGVTLVGDFGKEFLKARTVEEVPELPGTEGQDSFLLDLFTWTGSRVINDGAWFNYFALAGITKAPNGTAGLEIISGNLLFPTRQKNTQVMFSVRISGTIAGGAGTAREWRTQTRRIDGVTIVGSDTSVKVQGLDITNRDAVLASYTLGPTDPFMLTGIQLGMNNISGQTITLTSVSIRMMQTVNPE